ncbi:hypothetical protein H4F18_16530 [Vibrio scophthalmi]|uniref:hypothetical protein n=1 Tax=Vibrio scophthalmi TaxID=45658 RepID=UPI002FF07D9A
MKYHRSGVMISLLASLAILTSFSTQAKICKQTGSTWVKFSNHIVTSIDYAIAMPKGKTVEVGTGVKLFGEPRGSIYSSSKPFEITAYGAGALYVRSINGGSFEVCVDSSGQDAITLYRASF